MVKKGEVIMCEKCGSAFFAIHDDATIIATEAKTFFSAHGENCKADPDAPKLDPAQGMRAIQMLANMPKPEFPN